MNVIANVLPEYAQISLTILLPKALVCLTQGLRRSENTDTQRLAIDPITFEGATVRPDHLSVTTLDIFIVNRCLGSTLSFTGSRALLHGPMCPFIRTEGFLVYFHHPYLANILELTLVHHSEGQLIVLEA